MKNSIIAITVLSSTVLLSGCVSNTPQYGTTYVETAPGYTGYTMGAGSYNISNGYGPEFWTPGNNNSLWYNRVYVGSPYRGAYYGGPRGYYGGRGGWRR